MIYEVNSADLIAERADGGVDMYIISSGPIDASESTQKLLLDKVENYLGYIDSKTFHTDFPMVKKDKVTIIFQLEEPAPPLLLKLCEKIVPWVEDYGVHFAVEQRMSKKKKN